METELDVLQDIRALLNDFKYVFIDSVPDNQRKLDLHNMLEELGEKIRTFPKDSNGMAPSEATVPYQGHDCSYAELLEEQRETSDELKSLIESWS